MTSEEALKVFDMCNLVPNSNYDLSGYDLYDAAEIIREALEKRTSKAVAMWGDGYADGEIVLESYECPGCGCVYDFDTDGELKFCHECGQALEYVWSDSND